MMTLGSLFDGSGGFPLGGLLAGITPVWASEIEPFPIRVTTKRLPFMKHYGDISTLDGGKIEPVDIITFGSPCQDMSVAGRRDGLDGSRSSLFYEAIRIIKEMRYATNGKYPRYIVWENVPGAFSSNGGEDFKAVLEAVIDVAEPNTQVPMPEKNRWPYVDCYMGDGWSVAYRVLDAQFWGVPQRRKRIYLVADFAGGRAFDILFKSEGLSGYSAEGFRSWQRTAGSAADRTGTASLCLNDQGGQRMPDKDNFNCVLQPFGICSKDSNAMKSSNPHSGVYEANTSRTIDTSGGNPACNQGGMAVVCVDQGGGKSSCNVSNGLAPTLACTHGGEPVVAFAQNQRDEVRDLGEKSACLSAEPGMKQQTYVLLGNMIGRNEKNGPQGSGVNEDVSFTLDATDRHAVAYGIDRATYNMGQNAQFAPCIDTEVEPPMLAKEPGAVAHPVYSTSKSSYHTLAEENLVNTLVATDYKDPPTVAEKPYYIVRRLTPTECARLQGFPDWWCAGLGTEKPSDEGLNFWHKVFKTYSEVTGCKMKSDKQITKWLRDPHSDAAEYKMWGNGVALPCVWFVLCGIVWANG